MTTLEAVDRLASRQNTAISRASGQLGSLFWRLDVSKPSDARDALLEAYPALVDQHSDISATLAAEWYEDVRRTQRGGQFSARLATLLPAERSARTVRWAATALFDGDPAGTLSLLDGSLVRALGDASRETLVENTRRDRAAVGWHRLARPDGCDFCVMLSQRGRVYKRGTAIFSSHDNCRCRASPSWNSSAGEVDVMAYEASESMAFERQRANDPTVSAAERDRAQRALQRHSARVQEWIRRNRSTIDAIRAEAT